MVRVTFFTALVAETITLPNASEAGDTAAARTPVPERVTICGLLALESSTVILPPDVAPVAVGAKSTPITQLELAASTPLNVPPDCGQVVAAPGSRTKGPLKTDPLGELKASALD